MKYFIVLSLILLGQTSFSRSTSGDKQFEDVNADEVTTAYVKTIHENGQECCGHNLDSSLGDSPGNVPQSRIPVRKEESAI